jgi:hypothetical protein
MKNFTRIWMTALMLTATFLLAQRTQSNACSIAGIASATKDSICVSGTTTLNLTGYLGAIQWQSFDGTNWVNETAPGSTTDSYTVTLTTTTEYRAVVTEPTCPSDTSNTIIIVVGVTAPTTNGATRCGYGPVTLTANGGGVFKWYDSPSSTTPLAIGNSFTPTVGTTTTFYCAAASASGSNGTTPMPPQAGSFSSNARGYWFTAPSDFTITGLKVPDPAATSQNIAVLRFVPAVPPPFYATTTEDFVVLYLTQQNPNTGVIPVNIPITAGEVIGILGTTGSNDFNSYAPSPNSTVIDGQTVTISRMGMQFPLSTTAPTQIWQEAGGSISRVEITYEVGCESSRTPTVATVNTPPAITLSANPPALCQGQSSQLSVSSSNSSYNYTWSPATGLSSTTGTTVTANPLSPITYTVTADDGTCGNIDSVFISVGPASVAGNAVISTDTICLGSNATLFLTGNTGNIQWQSNTGSGWVNETGTGSTTGQYLVSPTAFTQYRAVVTSGGCAPDTTITVGVDVLAITDPVAVNDTLCGPGTANLAGNGPGVMNWFTAPTGGNSIFTGNTYTPTVSNTTTYYVEASAGGTYNVGPPNLSMGTQFPVFGDGWGVQFDVTQQISLDRVYISPGGTSGPLIINLRATQGGPILATKTVNVTAFTGLQPITLGWTINPGIGYRLEMGAGSVPLYYNSFGAAYPYTFAGSSVTIQGFVNPNFATGTFYYFFYNWEVTEGCKSNRVPVTAVVQSIPTVPTITQFGTVLTASVANNIQWYLNGSPIAGATSQTYDMALTGSGSYTVVVTDPLTGCTSESQPVLYTGLNDQLSAAGISMYPNPANDVLNFEFGNHTGEEITVSVFDKTGKLVLSDVSGSSSRSISLNIAAGTYSVEIKTSNGNYTSKLVKL